MANGMASSGAMCSQLGGFTGSEPTRYAVVYEPMA